MVNVVVVTVVLVSGGRCTEFEFTSPELSMESALDEEQRLKTGV